MLPGFVDAHIHPPTALIAAGADLQCDSVEQEVARAKACSNAHPRAQVARKFGWRYILFGTNGPSKATLERLSPDRPVFLFAIDGHSAWVNSKALELAGVDAKTPDPAPGFSFFQRDPGTQDLTGWLIEVPAVQAVLFKPQPAARSRRTPQSAAAAAPQP